jgi:uncharacterized membrane protein
VTEAAPAPAEPPSRRANAAAPERSAAIDLVRGTVMVLMVLDHARDFFFGFDPDPTDLATTTPILFATRWVTHFCAPGFVLLAGTAAYLYGRANGAAALRRFLFTRGLWLVLLEVTVVRLGWAPDPLYRFTLLQVIWAIGWSMVLLALPSALPPRVLAAAGLAIAVLHNLLDPIDADSLGGGWSFAWSVLHESNGFEPIEGHYVVVGYPIVPWVGVMALGMGLGEIFTRPPEVRRRATLVLGLATIAAFAIVRGLNVYGDPVPWSVQRTALFTIASFLDCEKYPPSLAYLLMTLGPLLVLLSVFERVRPPEILRRPLETFGRVPLFFYVAHLFLLRAAGIFSAYLRFGVEGFDPEGHAGVPGLPLWGAYLAWAIALAALYPACAWYADLKRRRAKDWPWLGYL